jgi:hypothetical protein
MIVLVKDIPAYAFSSGLNELVFATDQNKAVLSLTAGEKEILSETYIPDASGRITINDLQGLIEPYLVTNLIERCSYRITDGSSEQNKNFTVQFCAAESSMPAADFMAGYFLSTLMGEKVTAIGRKEFVHLVTTEACPVIATCVYYRDEDGLSTHEVSLRQVTDTDKIVTVEVSPELLVKPGFELVRYIIHAGVRTQTFSLDPDAPDVAPVLLFTNSFGCQETVYCTGTHALEPEYARSTAYTNGMFRNYRIDETKVFKANTGVLTHEMALWLDDLFRSKEIYLLEGTTVGKEITITESESKRSNDPDHLPFFTFSYRYAQRNHNILQLPRAGRVFDNTFDYTFE